MLKLIFFLLITQIYSYQLQNLEMSLRLWMCGGMVEQAPCSRVGHVFRKNSPYLLPGGSNNVVFSNTARLVDVWTDEYKQIYYTITPGAVELRSNVTNRIELRKNLKCKSFSWYLKNVYPESALNVVAKKHGSVRPINLLKKKNQKNFNQ